MTAKELTNQLNISVARLNQLKIHLIEGEDYKVIHSRLFEYSKSALRKLQARQKKYSVNNPANSMKSIG